MSEEIKKPTKAWEYINKDLDLLIILIFLEAHKEKNESLTFADFFKGNYWDIDDIKQEVLDTNDYLSICDMVFEHVTFLFEDLGLGKINQIGIGNTSNALKDLLIKVAEIGKEKSREEAPNFIEAVEQICFLEAQEQKRRAEEAEKNPKETVDYR